METTRYLSPVYRQAVREAATRCEPMLLSFSGAPRRELGLAAGALATTLGRSLYRIDLSQVVSRYIGETEKNLRRIFDRAGSSQWILFFDEADALFGKRTDIKDAHDKYAGQAVSMLDWLQGFPGLVVALIDRPPPPEHRSVVRHLHVKFPPD